MVDLDPDNMPEWLSQLWPKEKLNKEVIAGINEDDCAILKIKDQLLVITVDFLNSSPIAKELGICSFWDLGRLVVASNLSDLCGSGARPIAMLIAVVLERGAQNEDFQKLMLGVKFELDKYSIPLIGGDTKLGKSTALLGVAIGSGKSERNLFKKNSAKIGDFIWVSGNIGAASAAVDGLTNIKMDESWNDWAKSKLIDPILPLEKSQLLSASGLANGGTDLSDGLGADLLNLCKSSKVGAVIEVDKIPVFSEVGDLANLRSFPKWSYAFVIGGDFQFLITAPEKASHALEDMGFTKIGYITSSDSLFLKLENDYLLPMPTYGHRDGRRMSFSQEVNYILTELNKLCTK